MRIPPLFRSNKIDQFTFSIQRFRLVLQVQKFPGCSFKNYFISVLWTLAQAPASLVSTNESPSPLCQGGISGYLALVSSPQSQQSLG